MLFEIFGEETITHAVPVGLKLRLTVLSLITATLDSAVTVGEHGAKKFLMRDGKEVVNCLYFENVSLRILVFFQRCIFSSSL